jgi:hypothetical protein
MYTLYIHIYIYIYTHMCEYIMCACVQRVVPHQGEKPFIYIRDVPRTEINRTRHVLRKDAIKL